MRFLVFTFFLAGLLVGCDSESLQQDDPMVGDGAVLIGEYGPDVLDGDSFELKGARIDGMSLMLDVAYSGGCAEHTFAGFTPEVNIAIFPPQITVFVVHDGNGDLCEAYPSETVRLDIQSLVNAFGNEFMLTVQAVNSASDNIMIEYTN